MKLQSVLHLALLIGSWSVVNSKSNSNQSSGNSTKGIIRHQQTFETRLNHLLVDNVAGRVSFPLFSHLHIVVCLFHGLCCRRIFQRPRGEAKRSNQKRTDRGVNLRGFLTDPRATEVKSNFFCYCFFEGLSKEQQNENNHKSLKSSSSLSVPTTLGPWASGKREIFSHLMEILLTGKNVKKLAVKSFTSFTN